MNARRLIPVILILAVIAFVVGSLPSGFSMDLDRIGETPVTMVAVHDLNLVQSTKMMEYVDEVHGRRGDEVQILIADVNNPKGREFVARNGLRPVTILIYRQDELRRTLRAPFDANSIDAALGEVLDERSPG